MDLNQAMETLARIDELQKRAEAAERRVVALEGTLRPEVRRFAELMEKQLRVNDHKGGWSRTPSSELFRRLLEEAEELNQCLRFHLEHCDQIGEEAADVANFAMMIADVWKLLAGDAGQEGGAGG